MPRILPFLVLATLPILGARVPAQGASDPAFFESRIRPLLLANCVACHSDGAKEASGGLRLDSPDHIRAGGESGPILVPTDPDASRLVRAIRYADPELQMPPDGKLGDADIAAVVAWVRGGAQLPAAESAPASRPTSRPFDPLVAARAHWAFIPPADAAPPPAKHLDDGDNPIDRFVAARLDAAGLSLAPMADRQTLIRRATFDLTGLPPTPADVDAFVTDESPDAYDRLVDRLLASPHYGERQARRWLDLVRYADSNGVDENLAMANAWRYRDWVVRAFNRDLPYDAFVTWQLAGDLLPEPADEAELADHLTATGFLVLGPKMLAEQDKTKLVMDTVDEQIDVTSKTFLGLTVACARCHDHKFDPIRARDYYALAGILRSTSTFANTAFVSRWNQRELARGDRIAARDRHAHALKDAEAACKDVSRRVELESSRRDPMPRAKMPLRRDWALSGVATGAELDAFRELDEAEARMDGLKRSAPPPIPVALGVRDGDSVDVPVHIRGSHLNLAADPVPRAVPAVLSCFVTPDEIPRGQSGRLQLARWLTRADHPLTARVMVNRIWQGHFGAGLVRTSSNFGLRGEPPTHPELLDWLALRFVSEGWSMKAMHRLVMTSRTYRQSTRLHQEAAAIDPENRLLWRQARRRLDAEEIRDGILAIAGTLDRRLGGTLLPTRDGDYVTNDQSGNAARYDAPRRTIYLPVVRNALNDLLTTFDYADAGMTIERRPTTTDPSQALLLMNSPLAIDQSQAFARSLLAATVPDDRARVARAWLSVHGRSPTTPEVDRALAFCEAAVGRARAANAPAPRESAWQALCQVLFASNEFLYVD